MILFLLKACIVIMVLVVFYKLFLEKESFFATNRVYLLSCLLLAVSLPFLVLPKLIEDQGVIDRYVMEQIQNEESSQITCIQIDLPTTDSVATLEDKSSVIANQADKSSELQSLATPDTEKSKGWLYWMMMVYYFGVAILGINLVAQILNVMLKVWYSTDKIVDSSSTIINMTTETEPCSFFKYIFINPTSYDYDTYEQILAHEQVHVQQKHTFDLLLSELAIIFMWFNPFVWLLRKEIEKNIEYQTDHILLRDKKVEAEEYQLNLVKVATYSKPLAVTTNYNQSLIKNRIVKMSSKKSNPHSIWKYAFVAPLIFITLLLINQPLVTANDIIDEKYLSEKLTRANEEVKNEEKKISSSAASALKDSDSNKPTSTETSITHTTTHTTTTSTTITEESTESTSVNNEKKATETQTKQEELEKSSAIAKEKQAEEEASNSSSKQEMSNLQNPEKLDLRDTARLSILRDLAALGDNEAKSVLNKLSDIEFDVTYKDLPGLPDRTFLVSFQDLTLEERLDVMKTLEVYNNLEQSQKLEVYHIFDKYDLDKPDVLKVLEGKLLRTDMEGKPQYKLRYPNHYQDHSDYHNIDLEEGIRRCEELLRAVEKEKVNKTAQLLKNTNPNWSCINNKFPIIEASKNGNLYIVRLLLDHGADANLYLGKDFTPLMEAAKGGHLSVVKLLIERGARVEQALPDGTTVIDVARAYGHSDMVEFLQSQK